MAETRIVVETPCEHGEWSEHFIWGTIEYPLETHTYIKEHCSGGSRRVLSDALVVERDDLRVVLQDAYIEGYTDGVHDGALPAEWEIGVEPWIRHLDALAASEKELTGDCEIDCQDECAYPGQFTECELGAASGEDG